MPATQQHRAVAIATSLGDDLLLVRSFSLTEQLGRLSRIDVELMSEDAAIDFDQLIGTNATLRVDLPDKKQRFFNGFVSRFLQTEHQRNNACYQATLVPWLWFLTRTADCRIFQKKNVPDILEEVFQAHGFKDYKLDLSREYREWEYCVQYRETDFNFVSRLMEQEGIYYFIEHQDGLHTLVLVDSPAAHAPFPGYDTVVFRPRTHEGEETSDTVHTWVLEKEIQPGVYALSDFDFKNPAASVMANADISRGHEGAGFEIFDYPGEFEKRDEGESYAKMRVQELQSQHELIRAESTARGLAVGCKFTLKGHPREDQNRDYLVTGASYRISASGYRSGSEPVDGEFFSCSLIARPAAEPFRSACLTAKPLVQGPQTAIVVGKKGEEIDTDEFGRVKVQFHWDRYGKVDENSSCWIRVSQAWAGKNWGALSLPRIGHEVIVEFLEGDPDRPIITGRVYNAANKVPYKLPANKTLSTLKTNSSKGGNGFNEIRFEDKKGEEQIFIHGEKNFDLRIKNDVFESIGRNCHLVVKQDQMEHVENNRSSKVDADHRESIGGDRHLKVAGKEAKAVDGSASCSVKGDVIEVFKASHSEQVTGDFYLKADNVVIDANNNITLKVGGTHIVLEAGGIAIKTSGEIQIEAGATLDAKAGAPMTLASSAKADLKSPMTTMKGDGMVTLQGGMVKIN